jgi:hypothetical protein
MGYASKTAFSSKLGGLESLHEYLKCLNTYNTWNTCFSLGARTVNLHNSDGK